MLESAFQSFPGEDEESSDESAPQTCFYPSVDWHLLKHDDVYTAYAKDLDFMWRWIIVREERIVQEGCSLSLESSIRAVSHVLSFYAITELRSPEKAREIVVQH